MNSKHACTDAVKENAGQVMPVVRVPGPYQPHYEAMSTEPEWGDGWRIEDTRDEMILGYEYEDLKFASDRDCARACESLNEALANGEDPWTASMDRFKELVFRYLAW